MNRSDRISLFKTIKKEFKEFLTDDIENGVMIYYLSKFQKSYTEYKTEKALMVANTLKQYDMPVDIETVIEFFESLLDSSAKTENGIVFTPKYIADYIVEAVIKKKEWNKDKHFIDPGCGGGIFLISAAEILHKKYGLSIDKIIEEYIYGIDIEEDNVRRCILSLKLLSAMYGGNYSNVKCNIHCCDSLKIDWAEEFNVDCISYVIGNPPYVNPHDMNKETINFLKCNFKTTTTGVFNIFYAFIEHAMKNLADDGILGYIVPNNFLTIKSAFDLRKLLQERQILYRVIDFGNNMVFKPVRTYNCILLLTKESRNKFEYYVIKKGDDVETTINNLSFNMMDIKCLDSNGWKLVDEHTQHNLAKIENNMIPIKPFIRTGIATLKDAVFMVEQDENGYYKTIDSGKLYIESELVKPIYKIPELKLYDTIKAAERYIIFPYIREKQGYMLIAEDKLKKKYPLTYKVLLSCKSELDARDKGHPNPQGWYAYGRTQGLNKYGKKLLFPTFANHPKFMFVENEDALFCNGYAVFENEQYELELLAKILNSSVMDYYVSNTSYSIEGGYYCYQKKYIERFSIPWLSEDQRTKIIGLSGKELDEYLWNLYELY